ncbi:MAG: hypothetical protein RLY87_2466 [Chloroflexota bacterium]|jgi:hypothetical protein
MQTPTFTIKQYHASFLSHEADMTKADWGAVIPYLTLSHTVHGTPLKQATTVRIVATPSHLWFCFDCADADAWSTLTNHDDPIYTEEVVEVFIAHGEATPPRYFELEVNPANVRFDGIIDNPDEIRATMTLDTTWDPDWKSWTRIDPAGWRCVMALPWSSLGVDTGVGTWRMNLYRIDRPRDGSASEESAWSPTVREPADFHVPSRFGTLVITE